MSDILLIGGHGKVALRLAPLLVARGDTVTSVIRNPDQVADVEATGATALVLDIEHADVEALAGAVRGRDAIVWSAGAGGGSPQRTYGVDRDAAIRSMEAAQGAGVSRYVMVSYHGAGPDHGVPEDNPFYAYAQAKAAADAHLRASGLDWTVLGPGTLTLDEPTGRIDVGRFEDGAPVSRGNVALVVAAALADSGTIGRTIEFRDGDTPIAEAIQA